MSNLYVAGKHWSLEGTTQGEPIAMAMYGVATLPMLRLVQNIHLTKKLYADNGSAGGRLENLLCFLKNSLNKIALLATP